MTDTKTCTCKRESSYVFGGVDGIEIADLVVTDHACPEHGVQKEEENVDCLLEE